MKLDKKFDIDHTSYCRQAETQQPASGTVVVKTGQDVEQNQSKWNTWLEKGDPSAESSHPKSVKRPNLEEEGAMQKKCNVMTHSLQEAKCSAYPFTIYASL